ncbi:MAG: hypothetical protein MI892_30250, partial [Desulfobacterales bacterium]|nr:hypothetical protein [Desulfobacterales bacterium]
KQMDYRFTDQQLDPPDSLSSYTEQSIYLQGGCHCFSPPTESPLVGPLPALKNGFITFGVFNNHLKICETQLALWAEILHASPDSHLLMKFPGTIDPGIQQYYQQKLMALGIANDRFRIELPKARFDHLDFYNQVDIALDTFPFNGSMTTLEGLWMGVPVINRVGKTFVARVGLSILTQLDLTVFCAHSAHEYRDKAIAFAQQIDSLSLIRQSLRGRLLNSNICRPRRMAQQLERAFRTMWQAWVSSGSVE